MWTRPATLLKQIRKHILCLGVSHGSKDANPVEPLEKTARQGGFFVSSEQVTLDHKESST